MKLKVTVNGSVYDVDVEVEDQPPPSLGSIFVSGGPAGSLTSPTAPAHVRTPASEEKVLRAPISGTVFKVLVEEGQVVEAGDVLVILEAMKMETEITAPVKGTIAVVAVSPGDAVTGGQVLVEWH